MAIIEDQSPPEDNVLVEDDEPPTQNMDGEPPTQNTDDANEGARPRKKVKKWSEVWKHFKETTNKTNGKPSATCNYCNSELAAHSSFNGTSALKKHLASCKKFSGSDKNQTMLKLFSFGDVDGVKNVALGSWRLDPAAVMKSLVEMVILNENSFSLVEKEGFKRFCAAAINPLFKLPSRKTLARMCFDMYVDERVKLCTFFKETKQRISLTTDTWTSGQRISYMSLTAHYIDENWKLQKKIINFIPVASHKGEALGFVLERCLRDWGINKVYTLTVDNASSNDGVVRVLKNALLNWGTAVRGGEDLHMRCAAHIINLVVGEGSKLLNKSVCSVRGLVKFIRSSPMRIIRFKEAAEIEGLDSKKWLCMDTPTRWNSLYLMLDTAEKFEKAFERFPWMDKDVLSELGDPESTGFPEKEDWANVRKLVEFLSHFFYLTEKVFGSLYTTSNILFPEISEVDFKLQEWEKDVDGKEMAKKMRAKFLKYWGDPRQMNKNIFHALVLDPRHKMEFLEFLLIKMFGEESGKQYLEMVNSELRKLFYEYKVTVGSSFAGGVDLAFNQGSSSSNSRGSASSEKSRYHLKAAFKMYKSKNGVNAEKTELEKYLAEDVEDDVGDFNILKWWKVNAQRFPVVAAMARDVLGVPITTVASEAAFSTGGRVLDPFRSSLTPRMAQALICGQDWLRDKILAESQLKDEEDLDDLHRMEQDFEKIHLDSTIFD